MQTISISESLTLDPKNWDHMRELAHKALDNVMDYQMNIRDTAAWKPVPPTSEALFAQEAPMTEQDPETVVGEMLEHIVSHPAGHAHPRFWGWVCGTGTPIGMIADMLAAGVNASAGTFNDACTRLENQLLEWIRNLFEFPEGASGIVTSGASVANVIGMAVARDSVLKNNLRNKGLSSLQTTPVIYASEQAHSSVDKAMMLLGLGVDNLRKVPVNDDYEIDVAACASMIQNDREAGCTPIAIIANACTVNTGAIDDLDALADLAEQEKIWLHVDGAIGALAVMSPVLRKQFKGLSRADSIAFDFHKWLYVPYEAGCVLIRNGEEHRKSFSIAASYLEPPPRGVAAMTDTSNIRGPQLSRGFKALKIWAQIRQYGIEKLGKLHEQNVAHVAYLGELVDAEPKLERLCATKLNIFCFRYLPPIDDEGKINAFNQELLMRIQERGVAVPSGTRLRGKFAIRVANTNHRTRQEDFDLLVEKTVQLAEEMEQQGWLD